jgi:hypothetical protein
MRRHQGRVARGRRASRGAEDDRVGTHSQPHIVKRTCEYLHTSVSISSKGQYYYVTSTVHLSNCSSASTEIPEELAAGGKPATAGARATSEQATPSTDPKDPTTVETAAEQRASEQVPPEAPSVEHAAPEERQVLEPRQEAPE